MGSTVHRVRHDRATSLSLSLVKMSTAIKVYNNQVETIRCDKEDKHEIIKQVSVMQGYWIHGFSLDPSNLDWNSKWRIWIPELWISHSGLMLKCLGGQPHPCYTEFTPSSLCPYLPAAQFIPLQGTYSAKVSGALLHDWLSVLEIGIPSSFF